MICGLRSGNDRYGYVDEFDERLSFNHELEETDTPENMGIGLLCQTLVVP